MKAGLEDRKAVLLVALEGLSEGRKVVLRWAAAAYLETEQRFRKIIGYRDLWILQAALDEKSEGQEQVMAA